MLRQPNIHHLRDVDEEYTFLFLFAFLFVWMIRSNVNYWLKTPFTNESEKQNLVGLVGLWHRSSILIEKIWLLHVHSAMH